VIHSSTTCTVRKMMVVVRTALSNVYVIHLLINHGVFVSTIIRLYQHVRSVAWRGSIHTTTVSGIYPVFECLRVCCVVVPLLHATEHPVQQRVHKPTDHHRSSCPTATIARSLSYSPRSIQIWLDEGTVVGRSNGSGSGSGSSSTSSLHPMILELFLSSYSLVLTNHTTSVSHPQGMTGD